MSDTSVESTTEQSKQAASEVATDAKAKAQALSGTAKSEARSVVHDARSQAADVVDTTRRELRSQAAEQAKGLSNTLKDVSRQLSNMADNSDEPEAQVAHLARSAADTLGERAQRLDSDGIDGVVADVKRFARNRPGAFLLASVGTGFVLGRLAKHADLKQAGEQAKDQVDPEALKPSSDPGQTTAARSSTGTELGGGKQTSAESDATPDARRSTPSSTPPGPRS